MVKACGDGRRGYGLFRCTVKQRHRSLAALRRGGRPFFRGSERPGLPPLSATADRFSHLARRLVGLFLEYAHEAVQLRSGDAYRLANLDRLQAASVDRTVNRAPAELENGDHLLDAQQLRPLLRLDHATRIAKCPQSVKHIPHSSSRNQTRPTYGRLHLVSARPLGDFVGDAVRALRESNGWSQETVSRRLRARGLPWTRSQVADLEIPTRRRQDLTLGEVVLLAEALGVSVPKLLEDGDSVKLGTTERPMWLVRAMLAGTPPPNADLFGPSETAGIEGPRWVRQRPGDKAGAMYSMADVDAANRLGLDVEEYLKRVAEGQADAR